MMREKFDNDSTVGGGKKWYEEYRKTQKPCKHSLLEVDVLHLKEEGKKELQREITAFQMKQKNSNIKWLKTAVKQGTTLDKIAASIVLLQNNPKYDFGHLVTLVSQVRGGTKHNQCNMVIESLKELFLTDLLHPTFRLLKFEEQDLDKLSLEKSDFTNIVQIKKSKGLLAHWYFEHQLREQYEHFILNLSTVASDTVDMNREKAISAMTDLLIGNAEQEHKLLELIVNKIGDPSSRVGSKAVFCINKLLHEHPNMKLVVLREIEKLLFRKNVAQRAQYYAICLLAQFILDKQDDEVIAATLIEVYFAFFKACLKKGEPDSRMMAAILTGVNRAYPFANVDSKVMSQHIDSVYKVVHLGSFNVSLNALNLLHQITGKDESQANRFYSAFYKKLFDQQIGTANKHAMFLNLLYRVLQQDQNALRLYAFIKRILQVTMYFPANMACATLYIVSKVLQGRKDLRHMLLEPQRSIKVELDDTCEIKDNSTDTEDIRSINDSEQEEESIMLSNVAISRTENIALEMKPDMKVGAESVKSYDPFRWNPLYAGATKGFNTELVALTEHFHPSVALFATKIAEGKPIDYTGDPLEDLTLIRFLDRYVFKNPKKLHDKKIHRKSDPLAQRVGYAPKGLRSLPVDSAAYLNEIEERIPVDELFLYRFLKQKNKINKRVEKEDDEDLESVNSEEFNDMLDNLKSVQEFNDLDIAADIVFKRKKENVDEKSHSDDDNDNDGYSEDEIVNESDDYLTNDELQDLSDIDLEDIDNEDVSDIEFNDDSEEERSDVVPYDESMSAFDNRKLRKQKDIKSKRKEKKKGRRIDDNIFVSAEKFAEMLEDHSKARDMHGSSNALSNSDGASSKQIDWEMKRNQRPKRSLNRNKRKHINPLSNNNKRIKKLK